MAQMTVKEAAKKYLKDLECCQLAGSYSDCFYGVCAHVCVTGLLIQASRKEGSVEKEDAGSCRSSYVESCYPCVITEDCCRYAACGVCISLIPNTYCAAKIGELYSFGTNVIARSEIMKQNGVALPGDVCCHSCFPGCFCTSCNDSAFVRAVKIRAAIKETAVTGLVF